MADVGRITELWRAAADALAQEHDPKRMLTLALIRATTAEAECGRLREQRDKLGNELAQERAKPGGSFDQAALAQVQDEAERLREKLAMLAVAAQAVIDDSGAAGTWADLETALARAALGVVGEQE